MRSKIVKSEGASSAQAEPSNLARRRPPWLSTRGAAAPLPTRLLIANRGHVAVVQLKEIQYIQAAAKHIAVHAGRHTHVLRQPISLVETRLDPTLFVRVHRSSIVNVEYITEIHPMLHGDYEIVLRGGARLALSRRFKHRLNGFLVT